MRESSVYKRIAVCVPAGLLICFVLLLGGCSTASVERAQPATTPAETPKADVPSESAKDSVAEKPETETEKAEERESESRQRRVELSKGQERFVLSELWTGIIQEQYGNDEEARYHYRRILDIVPDSAHVLTLLAHSYLRTNEVERALRNAEKAIKAAPNDPSGYEVLAQVYAQQEKWSEAVDQWEKVLELEPRSPQALQQLAQAQHRSGEVDKAVQTYRRLIDLDPGRSGLYLFHIATILEGAERYPEAVDAYLQLLREYPDHFDIYMRVGQLYRRIGKLDEAVSVYLKALEVASNPHAEVALRTQLAQLYQMRGSRAEAYAQYAKIQKLSENNVEALTYMTLLLIQDGEYDKALATVDKLLSVRPRDPNTVLLKCRILVLKQEWRESADVFLTALGKSIAMADRDVGSQLHADQYIEEILKPSIRQIFLRAGKEEELETLLDRAAEKLDNRLVPLVSRIVRLETEDDPGRIQDHIEAILLEWDAAVSQNDQDTYNVYLAGLQEAGVLNRMMEEPSGTILSAILRKATRQFEDDAASPLLLSFMQFRNQEWVDAETTLELVLDRTKPSDQRHQMALERLALVYEKLERIADAERVLRKLIELDPKSAEAYNMLGYLFADNNQNLAEAESLIKKALELTPENGNVIDSLGWVYYQQGRYEEALESLIRAKEKSEEDHPVILDHLGDAYHAVGEIKKAVQMWRRALQVGPSFPFDFTPELKQTIEQKISNAERPPTP